MTLNVKLDLQIQFYDEKNVINISCKPVIKNSKKIITEYCQTEMVQ
jgi:fructose-specific phosphotransferase system component IIB